MKRVVVTPTQVAAARVRAAADKQLGQTTPAWILKLADTKLMGDRSAASSAHPGRPLKAAVRARTPR
jgi:hypothetical protein